MGEVFGLLLFFMAFAVIFFGHKAVAKALEFALKSCFGCLFFVFFAVIAITMLYIYCRSLLAG